MIGKDDEVDDIASFIDSVKSGCYTDDDGTAYLGTNNECSDIRIPLSTLLNHRGTLNPKYTHIWWYNK